MGIKAGWVWILTIWQMTASCRLRCRPSVRRCAQLLSSFQPWMHSPGPLAPPVPARCFCEQPRHAMALLPPLAPEVALPCGQLPHVKRELRLAWRECFKSETCDPGAQKPSSLPASTTFAEHSRRQQRALLLLFCCACSFRSRTKFTTSTLQFDKFTAKNFQNLEAALPKPGMPLHRETGVPPPLDAQLAAAAPPACQG